MKPAHLITACLIVYATADKDLKAHDTESVTEVTELKAKVAELNTKLVESSVHIRATKDRQSLGDTAHTQVPPGGPIHALTKPPELAESFGKPAIVNPKQSIAATANAKAKAKDGYVWQSCNWQCYLNRYKDLQKAFGATNVEAAEAHWTKHGQKEKRDCTCPAGCDPHQGVEAQDWMEPYRKAILDPHLTNITRNGVQVDCNPANCDNPAVCGIPACRAIVHGSADFWKAVRKSR